MNNNKLILSYLSNTKIIEGIIPFAQSIRLINDKNFDVVIIDTSDQPIPPTIKEILNLCDIKLIQTPKILPNLYIDRFLAYSNFLKTHHYDHIILSDLTDVYFQRNPFSDISNINLWDKVIISSENILIKNSPWNFDIIKHLYDYDIAKQIENNNVINSGIIAGNKNVLINLCNLIISEYNEKQSDVVGIDQGILMKIIHHQKSNYIEYEYAPYIFSIMLAVYFYYPKKLIYNYKTTISNINITSNNIPYSIVHQYNRNTTLKSLVIDHYKSIL